MPDVWGVVFQDVDGDEVDGGPDFVQHRFQNRTLKIFLKEMRSALNGQNLNEAFKILDDLEYVAHNLESPKRGRKVMLSIFYYESSVTLFFLL